LFLSAEPRRILAHREPVDLRKSIDGLVGLVHQAFAEDPLSGNVYVFFNRRGNYLKLVVWDRTGYCLFAKRLEQGRFHLPSDEPRQMLSEQAFRLILDGIALGKRRQVR
jgi:transposase